MQRVKSYSKNGINLDVNLNPSTKGKDYDKLQKVLKSKSSILIKNLQLRRSLASEQKPGIFRSIPRNILSSFQKCHTREQNVNAICNKKIEITKNKNKYFSMRKTNYPSYFETITQRYKKEHESNDNCEKLAKTMKSQKWINAEQSNNRNFNTLNTTTNKLVIPFDKQTERPFEVKLKKLQSECYLKPFPTDEADAKRAQLQKKHKLKKTRCFQSYGQHDFLNPEKISGFSSELNIHSVDLTKYKLKNQNANLKFDKFVNKILTKYDRDCVPWVSKLQYDCKENLLQKQKKVRKFSRQTERKLNEVHSKYPIRLAI